ncbi:DegQ family serine endoprotease [Zooshikella ganghwensis]|uniref:DegQ family serine endoprotease n=1 Tax=Zooshikella ganghwensis TaxID=202772 RepID=A0A4P9VMC5_9GAMM|nr:DegQ family serine endoprotease [Zooshikella ganghwensis]RDH43260.1 DegQ family serine endoprotease [Zooshikella ganghwensis]
MKVKCWQSLMVIMATVLMLPTVSAAALPAKDSQGQQLPTLAPLVKTVTPAVVNISTYAKTTVQNPLLSDPFFRHFFNMPPSQPRQQRKTQSAGSGVIINAEEGTVITNYHVIKGADEVRVTLEDGRTIKAEVVGSDPDVDIAVLDINANNLKALPLADSDKLAVGDFVIAVGNPFGLGQTVTTGVVSALGRSGLGIEGYENFIQTDASINPGNSGGALVNLRGELVGVNTAILAPSGGNVGIGFAIPTNMAKASVQQILDHGEVKRGQIGVYIQDLTADLAEAFNLDEQQRGVLINDVQPDSTAEKAGLRDGDIIIAVEGKSVGNAAQLRNEIGLRRIGDEVKVTILRDKKVKDLNIKIGGEKLTGASKVHKIFEGAILQNSQSEDGVLVRDIQAGSAAAYTGLRPGDRIIAANRHSVKNLRDLQQALSKRSNKVLLRIIRGNAALFLVIQ